MNGFQIKRLIDEGYVVVVSSSSSKDCKKAVIKFYLVHKVNNQYYSITKYQAIKYLNESQKSNLALFEEIKGLMKRDGINFSEVIANSQEIKRRCKDDVRFYTAYTTIKDRLYCEL